MIEVIPNYVDKDFEDEVIKLIPIKSQQGEYRNQVIRYGSSRVYGKGIVSKTIPKIFDRFKKDINFDSVTINEYMPNQEIGWHIDSPLAGETIYVISLLSDSTLQFRLRDQIESYFLPRYSLVKFSGEKRHKWEHNLKAENKRYSIVLREKK
jgi:hypothetical protein